MKNWWWAAIAVTLNVACTDLEEPSPIEPFDENLLVNVAGWSLVSEVKDDGTKQVDLSLQYAACVRDDHFKFFADHTYQVLDATTKCHDTDPAVKTTGSWKINGGVLTLTPSSTVAQPFTFTTASTSFGLNTLSEEEWVYTYLDIAATGKVASTTTVTMQPVVVQ